MGIEEIKTGRIKTGDSSTSFSSLRVQQNKPGVIFNNTKNKAEQEKFEVKLKELGLTNYNGAGSDVKAHYANNPSKIVLLKKIGNAQNGRSICQDANGNIVVVAHDGTILKSDFVKNSKKYEQAQKRNAEVKRNTAKSAASEFYNFADSYGGLNDIKKMQKLLDEKIDENNIMQFLDEFDDKNQAYSSIIHSVTNKIGASGSRDQKKVLTTIMDKLSHAAKKAGVSEENIKKYNDDFIAAYNKEYGSSGMFRKTNPKDMEKALEALRGEILAKQNSTGNISKEDAIAQVKKIAMDEHNTAAKGFNATIKEDGWAAKTGDTVCGWFGCNTKAELKAKLGNSYEKVNKLVNSSKTEAEFKANFKEAFGVEFDARKIEARNNAIGKLELASNLDNTIKKADKLLSYSDKWNLDDYRTALRENFQFDKKAVDSILDNYAIQSGKRELSDSEKKLFILNFLQDVKNNTAGNLKNVSGGKSLEQMQNDVELITRSTFGTNNVLKDQIQWSENQRITEMVVESGAEIAGTIALQAIPGLGQMAAARLAVTSSRWGARAVKVANYALKAETAFAKAKQITTATKTAQAATNIGSTGIATATVDLTNGKSVKEATQKALMNMSFAGVGASSSILAPKLMQTFGIADKALANEIAEEIINAAGSYGISKLEGGEYGSSDALVDFASGLIISRLSHVKGGEKPSSSATPSKTADPDADLNRFLNMGEIKAGSGIPEGITSNYSRSSVEKLSAFFAKKGNTEVYFNAIAEITERIKNGEVPSKKMLDEIANNISKQIGKPRREISSDLLIGLGKIDEMKGFVGTNYFSSDISPTSPGYKRKYEQFMSSLNKSDISTNAKPSVATNPEISATSETSKRTENPKPQNSILIEADSKIIKKYASEVKAEDLEKVINDIVENMRNGERPSREMITKLADKYNLNKNKLSTDLDSVLYQLCRKNDENYAILMKLCKISETISLQETDISALDKFKKSKNIEVKQEVLTQRTETQKQVEIEAQARQNAELKKQQEIEALFEQHPEFKDAGFRNDDNMFELAKVMDEYEQYLKQNEVNYENFDSTDIYQRLSSIKNDSDVDIAFDIIKKKYHPDVIAEENRIKGLKAAGLDDEMIKASDDILAFIKVQHKNKIPVTRSEIEEMIQNTLGLNANRNERVINHILKQAGDMLEN